MFWIFTKYEYVLFVIYYFIFQQNTKHKSWSSYGLNCANWTLIRMIKTDNEWILP